MSRQKLVWHCCRPHPRDDGALLKGDSRVAQKWKVTEVNSWKLSGSCNQWDISSRALREEQ